MTNKVKNMPNDIEEYENEIYLLLRNKQRKVIDKAIIDKEDYPLVKDYRWYKSDQGYVRTNFNGTTHNIHKMIFPNIETIDHIDKNPLNNKKNNLREATISQNGMNRKRQRNNGSGVPGVSYKKDKNLWHARIWVGGEAISLGKSKDFNKAVQLRKEAEKKYFKQYRPIT